MASERELDDFLKSVEKRAFKKSFYHVRDEDAALDIVQDSMIKLAQHYFDKPATELPMLFYRILANTTLDWFRRQKVRNALFLNIGEIEARQNEDDESSFLDYLSPLEEIEQLSESAESLTSRAQILSAIESAVAELPARQREAFLLRYWEELEISDTAEAMGCSEGSVKTHCFRAVAALSKALKARGLQP